MEIQQALEIVSYKLGAKNGESALSDSVLIKQEIEQAIRDKSNDCLRKIDAKPYMMATKLVKAERLRLARVAGEAFLAKNASVGGVETTASGLQY
ncbi:FKBP-type peptidyl-prolyl cis-trans isomerase N-terminal domain-containing protein [Rubritalea profundi]|uniref:Peptidyl-prolyl cis-trans isomerase FKBP-type N-terminal domain-containing protein n=1 Tax=Rubritalea profundi TaxID=1658618 RepID=A0A2S7U167_9BACT|nr:FKBP-type peptidyl-prolyl cis-trans isomerase N-terminal domain-containing protein [Rubritalea profundi]PQJ28758.1 hypothetical protein BSZ32_09775 [Rubritalea profundi]